MKLYLKYKQHVSSKEKKEAEAVKKELQDRYEREHTFDRLVLVRTIATKKFEFEQM